MAQRKRLIPKLLVGSSNPITHIIIKRSERVVAYVKDTGFTQKVVSIRPIWEQ